MHMHGMASYPHRHLWEVSWLQLSSSPTATVKCESPAAAPSSSGSVPLLPSPIPPPALPTSTTTIISSNPIPSGVAIIVGGGALLLLVLTVSCLIIMCRRIPRIQAMSFVDPERPPPPKGGGNPPGEQSKNSPEQGNSPAWPGSLMPSPVRTPQHPIIPTTHFTHKELASATDSFSQANLVGQGAYGSTYKGVLPNPMDGTGTRSVGIVKGGAEGTIVLPKKN